MAIIILNQHILYIEHSASAADFRGGENLPENLMSFLTLLANMTLFYKNFKIGFKAEFRIFGPHPVRDYPPIHISRKPALAKVATSSVLAKNTETQKWHLKEIALYKSKIR